MSPLPGILAGLILAAACGPCQAQGANIGLSLRVLPASGEALAAMDLPMPPQARALPAGRHHQRLLYPGPADAARRFYETTLPALGFERMRLYATGATWVRGGIRAELQFLPVVGEQDATGILVRIDDEKS
ncbi:hypothetical protein ACFPN1_11360 [Lysobacter yangpyeongensis]|uniref:Uncharacterized protein n=1 Tax=Lysobacter yangpyeongensis TaxID=346182 RepID=A0ABW0SNG1_9GAMM